MLPSIIAFILNLFLIIIVIRKNPKSEINQVWAFFLIFVCIYSLGEFGIRFSGTDADSAIFWHKFVSIGGNLLAASFLHFSLIYPKRKSFIKNNYLFYIIYFITLVFLFYAFFYSYNHPKTVLDSIDYFSTWGSYSILSLNQAVTGQVYLSNIIFVELLMVIGFVNLLITSFKYPNIVERRNIRFVLFGTVIFMGIGFIIDVIMPVFGTQLFESATIGATFMAIFVVYAILRYELMSVIFVSEEIPSEPIEYEPEPGYTYIIKEREPTKGFNLFAKAVSKGSHGICITAKHPKSIRDKYGLKRTPIIWITEKDDLKEITVKPSEIVTINDILKPFIDTSKNSVVILVDDHTITKGLVGIKSRQKILEISQSIFDTITHRNSRFIISSKPGSTTTGKPGSITKTRRPLLEFTRLSSFVLEEACNNVVQHLINTGTLTTKDLNKRLNSLTARDSFFLNKANTKITGNIFTSTEGPLNFIKITSGLAKENVVDKTQSFISAFEDLPHTDKLHSIALKTLTNYGFSEGEYLFHTGDTYIVQERKVKYSFEIFSDFLIKDYRGLCITISNPEKIMRKYNLNKKMVKMFWLTDIPSPNGDTIFPKLENISAEIERFISEYPDKKIIILDGIEYLITYSGDMFESVLRALRKLAGKISISNASLIIPLNPEIISKERMALLSRSGIEIIKPPK